MNIDDLKLDSSHTVEHLEAENGELIVKYANLGESYYRSSKIESLDKKVKVIIGNQATVQKSSTFTPDIDKLDVNIPPIDIGDAPVKDVVVVTETRVVTENNTYNFTERAELLWGYTFIPSKVKPEVQSIVPNEIHVIKDEDSYKIPQELMVALYGKNLTVYKYQGETVYPIVSFGNYKDPNSLVLNKNENKNLEFYT